MVHLVTIRATRGTSNTPASYLVQVNGATDGRDAAQAALNFLAADPTPEGFENLENIAVGQVLEFAPDAVTS